MKKKCTVCNEIKSLTEFYILKSGKPKSQCKECGKKSSRDYRRDNRERCCKRDSEYAKNNRSKLNAYCRTKYAENPEVFRERTARWEKKHPEWRRAWEKKNRHLSRRGCKARAKRLKKIGYLSAKLIRFIEEENIEKYGVLTCVYCETPISQYHLEHRIPIVRGGTNERANLAISCADCNLKKGIKTDFEFMEVIA